MKCLKINETDNDWPNFIQYRMVVLCYDCMLPTSLIHVDLYFNHMYIGERLIHQSIYCFQWQVLIIETLVCKCLFGLSIFQHKTLKIYPVQQIANLNQNFHDGIQKWRVNSFALLLELFQLLSFLFVLRRWSSVTICMRFTLIMQFKIQYK